VRVARIALEDLERRAADEVFERFIAGIGCLVHAEAQDVGDVSGLGGRAADPRGEREAQNSLLAH